MPFIDLVTDDEAHGEAAEMLATIRAAGDVPNHARLFALRPDVHRAWREMLGAITKHMDSRRYELVTLAAAKALGSSYCMLAHGRILLDGHYDAATLRGIVADHRSAGLDAVDVAVMDLAAAVATDAASVTREDVDRLLGLGLTQAEVFDVVLAAAARCFFSSTLDGLGVLADAAYAGLEPGLRDDLTVGRPIAPSGTSAWRRPEAG
ncbi:MAG: carboxymuconolactone decarboxylase family protein [Thermoleophilia bacterium]